ncbi:MAG: protoporphyrinogen oxidase [Geodermatophilaceae bacterium]|nr:protoporphyrinogen oxidase [Geodermatophilaceae bacterium]
MGDDAGVDNVRVVVVGAGIAGLTAAYDLSRTAPTGTEILVLEAGDRVGGKLAVSEVAGVPVDSGAEAALARVPEVLELMSDLGLAEEIVYPVTTTASIAVNGALRPVPAGTLLGVPVDLDALRSSGLLSPAGLTAVAADLTEPGTPLTRDVSVGALMRDRLGPEIVDRLIEPLLGGVYAGRTELLSVQATMPALAAELREHGSVIEAARAARAAAPRADGPVFASLRGGLARLAQVLAGQPGFTVRTGVQVRELFRTPAGFQLVTGPVPAPSVVEAEAVVIAVPANKAAALLASVAPRAAVELAGVALASMAVVTLAVPRQAFPPGSGLLVAGGGAVKAVTLSSQKWEHLDTGPQVFIRASVGRRGEEHLLQRSDEDLVDLVVSELTDLVGLVGTPVDARVTRWGGGLPQYDVGHTDRVRRIRDAVTEVEGLAVCGAAYDGVGVAACIRGAHRAAETVRRKGQWGNG